MLKTKFPISGANVTFFFSLNIAKKIMHFVVTDLSTGTLSTISHVRKKHLYVVQ